MPGTFNPNLVIGLGDHGAQLAEHYAEHITSQPALDLVSAIISVDAERAWRLGDFDGQVEFGAAVTPLGYREWYNELVENEGAVSDLLYSSLQRVSGAETRLEASKLGATIKPEPKIVLLAALGDVVGSSSIIPIIGFLNALVHGQLSGIYPSVEILLFWPDLFEESKSDKISYARSAATLQEIVRAFDKQEEVFGTYLKFSTPVTWLLSSNNVDGVNIGTLEELTPMICRVLASRRGGELPLASALAGAEAQAETQSWGTFGLCEVTADVNAALDAITHGVCAVWSSSRANIKGQVFPRAGVAVDVEKFLHESSIMTPEELLTVRSDGTNIYRQPSFRSSLEPSVDPNVFLSNLDDTEAEYSSRDWLETLSALADRRNQIQEEYRATYDGVVAAQIDDPKRSVEYAHAFVMELIGDESPYLSGEEFEGAKDLDHLESKVIRYFEDAMGVTSYRDEADQLQSQIEVVTRLLDEKTKQYRSLISQPSNVIPGVRAGVELPATPEVAGSEFEFDPNAEPLDADAVLGEAKCLISSLSLEGIIDEDVILCDDPESAETHPEYFDTENEWDPEDNQAAGDEQLDEKDVGLSDAGSSSVESDEGSRESDSAGSLGVPDSSEHVMAEPAALEVEHQQANGAAFSSAETQRLLTDIAQLTSRISAHSARLEQLRELIRQAELAVSDKTQRDKVRESLLDERRRSKASAAEALRDSHDQLREVQQDADEALRVWSRMWKKYAIKAGGYLLALVLLGFLVLWLFTLPPMSALSIPGGYVWAMVAVSFVGWLVKAILSFRQVRRRIRETQAAVERAQVSKRSIMSSLYKMLLDGYEFRFEWARMSSSLEIAGQLRRVFRERAREIEVFIELLDTLEHDSAEYWGRFEFPAKIFSRPLLDKSLLDKLLADQGVDFQREVVNLRTQYRYSEAYRDSIGDLGVQAVFHRIHTHCEGVYAFLRDVTVDSRISELAASDKSSLDATLRQVIDAAQPFLSLGGGGVERGGTQFEFIGINGSTNSALWAYLRDRAEFVFDSFKHATAVPSGDLSRATFYRFLIGLRLDDVGLCRFAYDALRHQSSSEQFYVHPEAAGVNLFSPGYDGYDDLWESLTLARAIGITPLDVEMSFAYGGRQFVNLMEFETYLRSFSGAKDRREFQALIPAQATGAGETILAALTQTAVFDGKQREYLQGKHDELTGW